MPDVDEPPTIWLGLSVRADNSNGNTNKEDAIVVAPKVAVTFTVVLTLTFRVVMLKLVEVLPAGTLTLVGTLANELLLLSLTTIPPSGAGEDNVTSPTTPTPPPTLLGLIERFESVGALTVKIAESEDLPSSALITSVELTLTGSVLTLNVPEIWPDSIDSVFGTVAFAFEDISVTTAPELPAFFDSVTRPEADDPPTTLVGVIDTLANVCPGTTLAKPAEAKVAKTISRSLLVNNGIENRSIGNL